MKLTEYAPNLLVKTRTFLDFCDQVKRTDSIDVTINAIRKWIGSAVDDTCDAVYSDLIQQDGLELTGVRDIRPLYGLKNLLSLKATDGTITNISTLSSLTNLKRLNLRNNNISSLGALASMTNLTNLDLAYNRLLDLGPLRKLTNLRVLKIFSDRNQIFDLDPINSLPKEMIRYTSFEGICEGERKWALESALISEGEYQMYAGGQFAPIYHEPTNRASGISEWIRCPFVVKFY